MSDPRYWDAFISTPATSASATSEASAANASRPVAIGTQIPAPRSTQQTAKPGYPSRPGKVRPMILLWALGIPIPVILVIVLVRGCLG